MKMLMRALSSSVAILVLTLATNITVHAQKRIDDRFANINGVRLHYLMAGTGHPVILLHGYAETSRMWRPLMVELAKTRTVVAPDLRGFGQSSKPNSGYDKKTMAQDVHALAGSLGYRRATIVNCISRTCRALAVLLSR
jgi:alpha-beta hydrolase superfamily lysophospholipase